MCVMQRKHNVSKSNRQATGTAYGIYELGHGIKNTPSALSAYYNELEWDKVPT
jgi:hypothetical protein